MKESPLHDILNTQLQIKKRRSSFFYGAVVLEAGSVILLAFVISSVLSQTLHRESIDRQYFLLLAVSLGARILSNLIQKQISLDTGGESERNLRERILDKGAHTTDGETFSSLFSHSVFLVGEYYRSYLPVFRKAIVAPPLLLLVVFYADPFAGLLLCVTAGVTVLFLVLTGSLAKTKREQRWQELRQLRAHFIEVIAGAETMRQLGAGPRFRENLQKSAEAFRDGTMGVLKVVFLSSFVLELMSTICIAMVAVMLGIRLIESDFSYQKALLILILIPDFFGYLRNLGAARHNLMDAESASPLLHRLLFDSDIPVNPPVEAPPAGKTEEAGTPPRFGLTVVIAAILVLAAHFSQTGLMMLGAVLLARTALQIPISSLHVIIAGVRFFGLIRPILRYGERLTTHNLALLFFKRIRLLIFDKINQLDFQQLRNLHSGEVLRLMDEDTEKLDNIGPKILWPLFSSIVVALALPFVPPFRSVSPAWGFVLLLWAMIVLPWLFYSWLPESPDMLNLDRECLDYAHGTKDSVSADTDNQLAGHLLETAQRQTRARDGVQWRLSILFSLSLLMIFTLWGILLWNHGHLQAESLAVVVFGVMSFTELFGMGPFLVGHARETIAAYHRIQNLISRAEVQPTAAGGRNTDIREFLLVKDLTWAWPGTEKPLFHQLNLKLEQGKFYGWVGPVGSGKSTLLDLVTGFHRICKDTIYLQGYDVAVTDQKILLAEISYVSQRSFVFRGSIKDNILLANPSIDPAEMERLLNCVGLPRDRYDRDRNLGEDAVILSGGERQRLILARAMARKSDVLLLDEPFNNLDRETQDKVLQWLKENRENLTLIMITHQSNGLELMDEVISVFGDAAQAILP